jgi:hypothetical protein
MSSRPTPSAVRFVLPATRCHTVRFFTTVRSGGTKRSELYGRSQAARGRIGDVVADVFSRKPASACFRPAVPPNAPKRARPRTRRGPRAGTARGDRPGVWRTHRGARPVRCRRGRRRTRRPGRRRSGTAPRGRRSRRRRPRRRLVRHRPPSALRSPTSPPSSSGRENRIVCDSIRGVAPSGSSAAAASQKVRSIVIPSP